MRNTAFLRFSNDSSVRNTSRRSHVALLALFLVIAQLGYVTHPLHLKSKQDGQKSELTCAFCIAGAHLQTASAAPVIHLDEVSYDELIVTVRDVCEPSILVTPRLTRGPPSSVACA